MRREEKETSSNLSLEKTFPFQNGHFFKAQQSLKVSKAILSNALGF